MIEASDRILEWTAHPAAVHPVRAAVAVMAVAMIAGAVYQATGDLLFVALSILIFLISLSPFFLPSRFRLTADGVSVNRMGVTRFLSWTEVRNWSMSRHTVYVAPYTRTSVRCRRGIVLLCPDNRGDVIEMIRSIRSDRPVSEPVKGVHFSGLF